MAVHSGKGASVSIYELEKGTPTVETQVLQTSADVADEVQDIVVSAP